MRIETNHVLVGDQGQDLIFSHYDEDGVLLETIAIEGGLPAFLDVWNFAQYNRGLYAVIPDSNINTFWIQEYSTATGRWKRNIVNGIDDSDPLQNPDSLPPASLLINHLGLDSQGFIYGTVDGQDRMWKWTNQGSFVRTYDTFAAGIPASAAKLTINPIDDSEAVLSRPSNPGIYRYNVVTETLTASIAASTAGGHLRNDFHTAGQYYKVHSATVVRVYAVGWGSSTDFTVTKPVGITTLDTVRTTTDTDIVWLFGRPSSAGQDWRMWKHQLSTNTVLAGPITLGTTQVMQGAIVYTLEPGLRVAQATLIGAT